jgi:hypothetical protein
MLLTIHFHHQLCTVGLRRDRISIILSVFDKCVNISDGRQWNFKCSRLLSFILSIPVHNAYMERAFSIVIWYWRN